MTNLYSFPYNDLSFKFVLLFSYSSKKSKLNELPRNRATSYLKGGFTTYNPKNSTVLALVRFNRASYTLFLVLVLLHILISSLRFHAPLLWQHNIRLSKILLPIISSSPVDISQVLLWLLFSLFGLSFMGYMLARIVLGNTRSLYLCQSL